MAEEKMGAMATHNAWITQPMKTAAIALGVFAFAGVGAQATIDPILLKLNATYTQNFDSDEGDTPPYDNGPGLAASGTDQTQMPRGWGISESGTSSAADGKYRAGTGSINTGDTYSFGGVGENDRALGTLRSGTLIPIIGARFKNDTSGEFTSLTISYTGEQWRLGAADRQDRLDFQISYNATSLTTGTWNDVNALDFLTPNSSGTAPVYGTGNDPDYRTVIAAVQITPPSGLAPGAEFWIRWLDFDADSSDDGLAIEDFALAAVPEPATYLAGTGALGLLVLALVGRRRVSLRRQT